MNSSSRTTVSCTSLQIYNTQSTSLHVYRGTRYQLTDLQHRVPAYRSTTAHTVPAYTSTTHRVPAYRSTTHRVPAYMSTAHRVPAYRSTTQHRLLYQLTDLQQTMYQLTDLQQTMYQLTDLQHIGPPCLLQADTCTTQNQSHIVNPQ